MAKIIKYGGIALLLVLAAIPAAAETVKCAECGMTCDIAAKFTARLITGDHTDYFCDIGDLFSYLRRKKLQDARPEVKDYKTGTWVEAQKAYYVHSEKKFRTPMGWSIAAFISKDAASEFGTAVDFDTAVKTMK